MIYKLPDGKQIDLSRVRRISSVRDFGQDKTSIEKSKLGFTVHLDRREVMEIWEYYHYSDWAAVKKKMCDLRADLYAKWETENNKG